MKELIYAFMFVTPIFIFFESTNNIKKELKETRAEVQQLNKAQVKLLEKLNKNWV